MKDFFVLLFIILSTSPIASAATTISTDIITDGRIGIATTSPTHKLSVNGNILGTGHAAIGSLANIDGDVATDVQYQGQTLLILAEKYTSFPLRGDYSYTHGSKLDYTKFNVINYRMVYALTEPYYISYSNIVHWMCRT